MKVLLVDIDSKIANLALMKLSKYHKLRNDQVELRKVRKGSLGLPHPNPDKVYVSCVFSKNRTLALNIKKLFSCPVEVGGYGVNDSKLQYEIEHTMPDYDLYGINYSLGFTSRGCIRNCGFCIVPKKEGYIKDHAPISEFLDPFHDRVVLLDNNFLASSKWKENLFFIRDHDLRVNFNQGLDIRLVNRDVARLLKTIRFSTFSFKSSRLHFAFDFPYLENEVRRGVKRLKEAGIPPSKLTFYFLTGFNTTHGEDMHRFEVLRELGTTPYCMKYNDRSDDRWLNHFDRWVNAPPKLYKLVPFEEYLRDKK